jgi:hypothetical protein
VQHYLFKDHTTYKAGRTIKNLQRLRRDPRSIVLVDHLVDSGYLQPENHILLPEYGW